MALLFVSTPARLPVWQQMFDAAGLRMIAGEAAVTDPAEVTRTWQRLLAEAAG